MQRTKKNRKTFLLFHRINLLTPGRGKLKYSVRSGLEIACTVSITSFDTDATSPDNHVHMSLNTSKFSLAILLFGCADNARAADNTCGP